MIVKNESHIIRETLDSIYKYIDYWIISDTGSSDNTKEIIREYFEEKNIDGYLIENEWKDFGYNRSIAMKEALKNSGCDYIFVMDADDLLHGELKIDSTKKNINIDMYLFNFHVTGVYRRPLLFSTKLDWQYIYKIHESVICNNKKDLVQKVVGSCYIESRRLGDRSKDKDKYKKDAELCVRSIEECLNSESELERRYTDHYIYYAAQSYNDYHDTENAKIYYKKYITMGNSTNYIYISYLKLGKILLLEDDNEEEIYNILIGGYKMNGKRIESLYYLSKYNYDKKRIEEAYEYIILILDTKIPTEYVSFIEKDVYEYKRYDLLLKILTDSILLDIPLKNLSKEKKFEELLYVKEMLLKNSDISINYKVEINKIIKDLLDNWNELKKGITYEINNDYYNKHIIKKIKKHLITVKDKKITLVIRVKNNLFEKTINSFMNCCKDITLIDEYICISENKEKEELYPFMIFKMNEKKKELDSLNMMIDIVNSEYILYLEDDWLFCEQHKLISSSLEILEQEKIINVDNIPDNQDIHNKKIGQVIFNKNYTRIHEDSKPGGYICKTNNELEYIVHEYYNPEKDKDEYMKAQMKNMKAPVFWPHLMLIPCLIRTDVFKTLGKIEDSILFLKEYAELYTENNYITCFLNKISCRKISK